MSILNSTMYFFCKWRKYIQCLGKAVNKTPVTGQAPFTSHSKKVEKQEQHMTVYS